MINKTIKKRPVRKKLVSQKKETTRKFLLIGALTTLLLALLATAVLHRGKEKRPENTGSREMAATGEGIALLPSSPTAATDLEASPGGMAGEGVTYRWLKNKQLVEGATTARLAKSFFAKGDIISVTRISGGKEETASVTIMNARPKVTSVSFSPEIPAPGSELSAIPVGVDEDGDYIRFTYTWNVNGNETGVHSAVLPGNAFKKGDRISVTVLPFDAEGDGPLFISDTLTTGNSPPRFVSTPASAFSGSVYSYTAVATDPDGDPLVYSLAAGPQGMTIDSATGTLTWQIAKDQAGTHTIEIVATDPGGLRAFQKYSFAVALPGQGVAQ